MVRRILACCSLLVLAANAASAQIVLDRVVDGLTRPVAAAFAPGDTQRIFVAQQEGQILVVKNGTTLAQPFLDLSSLVSDLAAPGTNERGLLDLTFHPQYQTNGYFYVYYMTADDTATVLARYTVSADPEIADAASASVVLTVAQPFDHHNGGHIAFGPDDYLYLSLGDGGFRSNAQQLHQILGKMLRLDVDSATPYAIPVDNPYAAPGGAVDEIWSVGWRNPWRFSFDRDTGDLYVADVGTEIREEIDFAPAASTGAENYGYCVMEGTQCNPPCGEPTDCNDGSLTLPIFEYERLPQRCGVIGGYVYRGTTVPSLQGHFVFGDLCDPDLLSIQVVGGALVASHEWPVQVPPGDPLARVVSFAEDHDGELFVVDWGGPFVGRGQLFKITAATPTAVPPARSADRLLPSVPNPFNPKVAIRAELAAPSSALLEVVDARGRVVRVIRKQQLPAGISALTWDGRDDRAKPLASGVYLLRLTTARGQDSAKITLVR